MSEAARVTIKILDKEYQVGCTLEAWKMWLEHSKMIVNEYRLDLASKKAHEILVEQCEQYFFGEGAALPPDYVAPQAK